LVDLWKTYAPSRCNSLAATSSASTTSSPGAVAGLVDGLEDDLDRLLVGAEVRREAALVADGRGLAAPLSTFFRLWKISTPARSASGNVSMPTGAIMNSCRSTLLAAWAPPFRMFMSGTGSSVAFGSAEVAVERQAGIHGGGPGDGHGHGEDGVGAERRLVRGAVQLDHRAIDGRLVRRVHADDGFGDLVVDVRRRAGDALAEVAPGVAVAQLDGLGLARGCAARHGGAAGRAALEHDFRLERRVAARVEDLTSVYAGDDRHRPLRFRPPRGEQGRHLGAHARHQFVTCSPP
jgi:hypothetical protein